MMKIRLVVFTMTWLSFVSLSQPRVGAQEPAPFRLTPILSSGDVLASEISFAQFGAAVINDAGQVAFIAGDGSGLYLLSEGMITPLALTGESVPGLEGSFFGEITDLALNNQGDVAFVASAFGAQKSTGVFLVPHGGEAVEAIIASGDRVPGPVFANFQDFRDLHLNDNGELAFTGVFRNTESGAFLFTGGAIELVAITNQDAPGTNGGQFRSAEARSLAENGTVLVQGRVRDGSASGGIFLFQNGRLTPVIFTGQDAPGTDGGMFFRFSHATLITEAGDLAFESFVLGGGAATGGIFIISNGEIKPVVFGGQPIAAAGDRSILEFAPIASNGQGEFAFRAMFEQQEQGIFVYSQGTLSLVLSSDQMIADSVAQRFIPTGSTSLNAQGTIAFVGQTAAPTATGVYLIADGGITAAVTSQDTVPAERRLRLTSAVGVGDDGAVVLSGVVTGNGAGVYLAQGSDISPLIVSGQATPDTGGGITRGLADVVTDRFAVTSQGEVAVAASVTGGSTAKGVFRASTGILTPVALADQPVPGVPDTSFLDFDQVVVSRSGVVAFSSILDQGDDVLEAILLFRNGGCSLVATAGQSLPGGDELFSFLSQSLWVNDAGAVAFVGELDDGRLGVFLSSGNSLKVIALSEDEAPGTDGQTFESFGNVMINDQGMVVFDSEFSEGGGGVFVFARDELRPVAVSGDDVPGISGQTFRTFRQAAINDRGEIAFAARWGFRGGQGFFFLSDNVLTPVVVNAQQVEGGGRFSDFFGLSLNNGGELVFSAALDGSSQPSAVFLATPGSKAADR